MAMTKDLLNLRLLGPKRPKSLAVWQDRALSSIHSAAASTWSSATSVTRTPSRKTTSSVHRPLVASALPHIPWFLLFLVNLLLIPPLISSLLPFAAVRAPIPLIPRYPRAFIIASCFIYLVADLASSPKSSRLTAFYIPSLGGWLVVGVRLLWEGVTSPASWSILPTWEP
ncbi:hypothetical protein R3P38DRAFT_875248 [Favolaschia claudopus]|uniref:Uncharacterized protein n=1 Tax=Favolaschia claudopus TaxID=2862362 RepID=A0AAW0BSH2_9AGAR